MKRILCFLLAILMLLGLVACGKEEAPATPAEKKTATAQEAKTPEKESFEYEPVGVKIVENPYPDLDLTGLTDVQKAVAVTAESYYMRGSRIQYEDTRFLKTDKLLYYRWAVQQRSLEEYTSQNIGFLQCAAFCYEVYRNALDLDLIYEGKVCYYTSRFDSNANHVLRETPVASGFSKMSKEALDAKKQEFLDTLQPGDIIVYRVKTNGHAMLYVGNGTIIHSTGSVYDWEGKKEVYEEFGTVRKDPIETLLTEGNAKYIFNKQSYCIVRPIVDFNVTEIPEKSRSRMEAMRGVVAEKLSDHTEGQTVTAGETVTYTFSLQNMTKEEKTLTITDTLPSNTEYVSGDLALSDRNLSATVTLPAEGKTQVSYTLRVNQDTPAGTKIASESFVEAVPTNCSPVTIGNTLNDAQIAALQNTYLEFSDSELSGIELANAIYKKALGYEALPLDPNEAILEKLFRRYSDVYEFKTADSDPIWPKYWRSLDENSDLLEYLAPNLYGGRYLAENTSTTALTDLEWFKNDRTRYVCANRLVPGDIILTAYDTDTLAASAYLYTGTSLLDLQNNVEISPEPLLSRLVSDRYFVVLRPSLGANS